MTPVTNGVLCFLTTARQSYSTENLISMCVSFYSYERILDAKKVLFSLTGESAITRRGEGKFRSEGSESTLKAANNTMDVYVGRCSIEVTCDLLKDYIE